MKKISILTICGAISILLFLFCALTIPSYKNNFKTCFSDLSNSEEDSVIALLLYNEIDKAIQEYYSEPTQFALYDSEISNISQIGNEFSYQVTIKVQTFNGPHNPPYGLEILTFSIKPGTTVLDKYEHLSLNN